jgi:sulfur transfer complex TusBCD TusB component (DsrH family)
MASTAGYLVIETKDAFASGPAGGVDALVEGLAHGGPTTVVLAQNGVLAARRDSTAAARLSQLAQSAHVLADDFSLRERGIRHDELTDGVAVTTMDEIVGLLLADGCRAFWH